MERVEDIGGWRKTGNAEGGTRTPLEALFGWLGHSLDGPVERKSVLFLSIFVESYQFVWNSFALSFALMVWVNRLRVCTDMVSEKAHQKMEKTTHEKLMTRCPFSELALSPQYHHRNYRIDTQSRCLGRTTLR